MLYLVESKTLTNKSFALLKETLLSCKSLGALLVSTYILTSGIVLWALALREGVHTKKKPPLPAEQRAMWSFFFGRQKRHLGEYYRIKF